MSHIFISYKSQERQYALAIHDKLIEWGYDPWLDVKRLKPGGGWRRAIDTAIKSSVAMIGVWTPLAFSSDMVTNEWNLAIAKQIPFIPLLYEGNGDYYPYNHLQYIDFCADDKTAAFGILKTTLETQLAKPHPALDKIQLYLQGLYDYVTTILQQKIIRRATDDPYKPIELTMESNANAVDTPIAPDDDDADMFSAGYAALGINIVAKEKTPTEFNRFNDALAAYEERLLLLGEPGAGKTMTLLNAVQDAVVARMLDERQPLPLYGVIATWKSEYKKPQSLSEWLAAGYKKYFSQQDLTTIISEGSAFLLLDGLDELGTDRPKNPEKPEEGSYDPRLLFIQQLPENNQLLITCRKQEYESLGEKIKRTGAVTLQPLNTQQMQRYLNQQPELLAFIQSDSKLQEWLDTPLLLSFFAFSYQNMNNKEKQLLKKLQLEGDFRDRVFDYYIRGRIEHETLKYKLNDKITFGYEEIIRILGGAMTNALGGYKVIRGIDTDKIENTLIVRSDFRELLNDNEIDLFIELMKKLQLLIDTKEMVYNRSLFLNQEQGYRPIHLLLLRYFIFKYSNQLLLTNPNSTGAFAATHSLGILGDDKALKALSKALKSKAQMVKLAAIHSLAQINAQEGAIYVKQALKDKDPFVRSRALEIMLENFPEQLETEIPVKMLDDSAADVVQTALYVVGQLKIIVAIPQLINLLDSNHSSASAQALEKIGIEGINALRNAITNPNPKIRGNAAFALNSLVSFGKYTDSDFLYILEQLLDDPDSYVRHISAKAITFRYDEESLSLRISILSNTKHKNWIDIARNENVINTNETIIELIYKTLEDSNIDVVLTSISFFQRVIYPQVANVLLKLIKHENRVVQIHAIDTLKKYHNAQLEDELCKLIQNRPTYQSQWINNIRKLDDFDLQVQIIEVLGELRSKKCVKYIVSKLELDNFELKRVSIIALGKIQSKKATLPLVNLLEINPDETILEQIVISLGKIRDNRAIKPLCDLLFKQVNLSQIILESLERIGTPEALEAVRRWREGQT